MMNPFEQASVVLSLAESLRKRGSWTGETHVQKAMYFLQELLKFPRVSSLSCTSTVHSRSTCELR